MGTEEGIRRAEWWNSTEFNGGRGKMAWTWMVAETKHRTWVIAGRGYEDGLARQWGKPDRTLGHVWLGGGRGRNLGRRWGREIGGQVTQAGATRTEREGVQGCVREIGKLERGCVIERKKGSEVGEWHRDGVGNLGVTGMEGEQALGRKGRREIEGNREGYRGVRWRASVDFKWASSGGRAGCG